MLLEYIYFSQKQYHKSIHLRRNNDRNRHFQCCSAERKIGDTIDDFLDSKACNGIEGSVAIVFERKRAKEREGEGKLRNEAGLFC